MAGRKRDPVRTETTRKELLESSYELFSQRSIESVSMEQAANAAGYGVATLYRYYGTKPGLVVAVATWKWEQFAETYKRRLAAVNYAGLPAAGMLARYLDAFTELYRNHPDILRFNQFFNVYIQAAQIDDETLAPYREMIGGIAKRFHAVYEKAAQDRTVRTDVPEEEMFRTTLHLMLAAATRYAVGLVYRPCTEAETQKELETLKCALLREYTARSESGERNSESGVRRAEF